MIDQQIDIATKDGKTTTFITHPERGGPFPVIIFYMDAPAIREELRDMARRLCDVLHPTGRPGDPYLVVVEGTHSAQFVYRTPDVEDPMCDSRDEADGSQGFSFASEPALATVAFRNGLGVVSIDPLGNRTTTAYKFLAG